MQITFECLAVATNRTPGQPDTYNIQLQADPDDAGNKAAFNGLPTASISLANLKTCACERGDRATLTIGQPAPAPSPPIQPSATAAAPPTPAQSRPRTFGGTAK